MFAALPLEREPFQFQDVPGAILDWVQTVGGYAAFAAGLVVSFLILRYLFRLRHHRGGELPEVASKNFIHSSTFKVLVTLVVLQYLVLLGVKAPYLVRLIGSSFSEEVSAPAAPAITRFEEWVLTSAALCALLVACIPLLLDLPKLRWRRIWALARLSFKEALRRRILWVFSAILLVFLFGSWFLPYDELKPEDQVRNYVAVVYWAMTPLLLIVACWLAAFSIPTDIKSQTIHTILTKPVERFEIVLGRIIGYSLLMTLILAVMTGVSLLWFIRAVDPDAANESFKARVPLYGAKLEFEGTESKEKGTNVGKEWDYRSYVSGKMAPGDPPQYAIWSFPELPAALTKRDKARCEFNFDVYRTTKGQENRGVFCTFRFETRNWDRSLEKEEQYKVEMRKERESNPGEPEFSIANRLAKKHGYYELPAKEVVNFHTLFVDVPPGLIENALEDKSGSPTGKSASADAKPPLRVRVECISRTQFLGMAKYDLYFRLDNPESGGDQWLFGLNFFKGAGGLWLRLCLVIAVAVSLSTYLTGIISFLTTLALYGAGMSREFIETLSEGKVVGGGPAEAFMRLVTRETLVSELEKTATLQVATGYDVLFKWFVRRVLNMIPDVDRFDFADRIREGFDVSGGQLSLNFLLLVGYALPWAVLAYYLMKSREVAAS